MLYVNYVRTNSRHYKLSLCHFVINFHLLPCKMLISTNVEYLTVACNLVTLGNKDELLLLLSKQVFLLKLQNISGIVKVQSLKQFT